MIIDIFRNLQQCKNDNEKLIVANLVAATLVSLSIGFSAFLLAVTYLWGWIGFTSLVGVCLIGCLVIILCGDDE